MPIPRLSEFARAMDLDTDALKQKLAELRSEHRDLDDVVLHMSAAITADALQLQRLKKRKLALKDQIARLESMLVPDIIA